MPEPADLELRIVDNLREIPAEAWDALTDPSDSPFVAHAWLQSLEEAKCVGGRSGWAPRHVTLWREGKLVAAAPAYEKVNSEGEFVFDHGWASASERAGVAYYPKLVVAVPFTPATGGRLLASGPDAGVLRAGLAKAIRLLAEGAGLSGAHVLFPNARDYAVLEAEGFAGRYGAQYHWENRGYATYDDFLATFNSKRRNQLKRERRDALANGLTYRTLRGDALTPEARDAMYGFYSNTADRYYPYTRRYLTRRFFDLAAERMPNALEFVFACDGDEPVAGAFNVAGGGKLYGRYWGSEIERPFLHFHVCYYHAIEECIARGASTFEPGAGGGHKLPRGFEPTMTYSAHVLTDPRLDRAVRSYLVDERRHIEEAIRRGDDD